MKVRFTFAVSIIKCFFNGLFYFIIFLIIFKNLFLFIFWLRWVFVAARGLSLVVVSQGYSSSRCVGFSLRWLLLLRGMGSRRAGFSSCGSRAQLLRGMWDLPGPGLEPVSLALAGRFLTTAPAGKPNEMFKNNFWAILRLFLASLFLPFKLSQFFC